MLSDLISVNDPLRILVLTSTFPRWAGDTEPSFVFSLCKYLQQQGIEIDVIAPHAAGAKKYEVMDNIPVFRYRYFFSNLETLAYAGGIMANLKKNRLNYLLIPLLLFSLAVAVLRKLATGNYQLIHAHWIIPQGFICILIRKILGQENLPVLCTSHGGDLYALDTPIFRNLKRWTIKHSDCLSVVSHAMKEFVRDLCNDKQDIRVIPMGVDLRTVFIPVPGVTRHDNRLIFVGRLVEKKGVTNLIEAVNIIRQDITNIELLVVGDGPLRATLENETHNLNLEQHIHFKGAVTHEQLPELYSSSAVAVVPSIIASTGDQEGLGLVIIEAMGCGCAVVASDLDAVRDIIDEESGMLTKPADAHDLAEKIQLLLLDQKKREQLSVNGRQRVVKLFDMNNSGKRYHDLIRQLIHYPI
jgi:glycosyltransferase involved in cell wall biosynthesis